MLTDSAAARLDIRPSRTHFALITVRIGWFPFVVLFPLRCFAEVIEGFSDILCLFQKERAFKFMQLLESIYSQMRGLGALDIADIDVKSQEIRVRIRMLTR